MHQLKLAVSGAQILFVAFGALVLVAPSAFFLGLAIAFYFSAFVFASFFCADSICWMLDSGLGRFSGMVPPSSSIVWRTLRPTSKWV